LDVPHLRENDDNEQQVKGCDDKGLLRSSVSSHKNNERRHYLLLTTLSILEVTVGGGGNASELKRTSDPQKFWPFRQWGLIGTKASLSSKCSNCEALQISFKAKNVRDCASKLSLN